MNSTLVYSSGDNRSLMYDMAARLCQTSPVPDATLEEWKPVHFSKHYCSE